MTFLHFKINLCCVLAAAMLVAGAAMPGHAADDGISPALCGAGDKPEPSIQGDVPFGAVPDYNCGLTVVGQLPVAGAVQAAGHCAYVARTGQIAIIDVSDPTDPMQIGALADSGGSHAFRVVENGERAVMVTARNNVYDVSDCENPVLKGVIDWPPTTLPGIPLRPLPHDFRINHAGTKVYASFGMWEADITDLDDDSSWTITDHSCEVFAQFDPIHMQVADSEILAQGGLDLCVDLVRGLPLGANFNLAASPFQSSLFWQPFAHGPDLSGNDTRLYVADVGGGFSEVWRQPALRIIDLTTDPPEILDEIDGAGYSVDWFRADGREFVLHNGEGGTGFQVPFPGLPPQPGSDTCVHESKRPHGLGWAFDAFITQVTPDRLASISRVQLAINKSEFCDVRMASGHNPFIGYHSVDNPYDAKFAMLSFGTAGLRVFDIRKPAQPREVAYFNFGPESASPHYDAARKLIFIGGSSFGGGSAGGFKVLQIQDQVAQYLGL